jgi:hypothetical protein
MRWLANGIVLKGFLQTHGALVNNNISILCSMGDEIDEVVGELHDQGLRGGPDFIFLDAGGYAIQVAIFNENHPHNISVGVDWLKARYKKEWWQVRPSAPSIVKKR